MWPRLVGNIEKFKKKIDKNTKISTIFFNRSKYRVCARPELVGNIEKFPKKSIKIDIFESVKISCLSQKYRQTFSTFQSLPDDIR